jgi:hypothetical protein
MLKLTILNGGERERGDSVVEAHKFYFQTNAYFWGKFCLQNQCCGAGAGAARSRIFWSEPEPQRDAAPVPTAPAPKWY